MTVELSTWLEQAAAWAWGWRAFAVAGGAGVEYVLPFLPGDTLIVAAASVGFAAGGWPVMLWAIAVLASTVGGAASYEVGRWFVGTGHGQRFRRRFHAPLHAVAGRFERYGHAYLAVNRFVPGLRTFFFLGAAFAGLSRAAVWGWGALSSALWMTLLFGLAFAFESNIALLESRLGTLNLLLGAAAVAIVVSFARTVWKARRDEARDATPER